MREKRGKTYTAVLLSALLCIGCILCTGCGGRENNVGASHEDGPSETLPTKSSQSETLESTDSASAVTMRMIRYQGTVEVTDRDDKSVASEEPLALYSGYKLKSLADSYAWINLDDTKLAKLDQESNVGISKDGAKLKMTLGDGGLFFQVTETLKEEESLEIQAGTIMVGIRGTCGWVYVGNDGRMDMGVGILEGAVDCSLWNGEAAQVLAGEMLTVKFDGEGNPYWSQAPFAQSDIPEYVWEELDQTTQEKVTKMLSENSSSTPESGAGSRDLTQVDPETLGPEEKIEYYLEFMEDGREMVFDGNITLFGREINTITIDELRDTLVEQGLAESRLFTEQIEGLGTQLMYSGNATAFLDLPVDAVQSPNASSVTSFSWIKEYPDGTPTGILDINSGDSIETVLQKMGFTSVSEIGAVLRENPDISPDWSSYNHGGETWSIADLPEGAKAADNISFDFNVWPGNQYAETEAFLQLSLSTMYKTGSGSMSNKANLRLYFNNDYKLYSLDIGQLQ